jgi:iron complex transport system substrate-binding protein
MTAANCGGEGCIGTGNQASTSMPRLKLVLTLYAAICLVIFLSAYFKPSVSQTHAVPEARVRLQDMMGDRIAFDRAPQKIVIGSNTLAAFAMIEENTHRIVAAAPSAKTAIKNGLISKIYPQLETIPLTGLGAEELIRLAPDAILLWNYQVNQLREMGFPQLIQLRLPASADSADLRDLWTLLGKLAGRTERVERIFERYVDQLSDIRAQIPALALRPKVVLLTYTSGLWQIGRKGHYYNHALELAEIVNLAKDLDGNIVGLERLIELDPDAILLTNFGETISPDALYGLPEMYALRAVRAHRVYRLPSQPLYTAPVTDPLLVRWLAELLHPDAMSKEMREAYWSTYVELLHYPITEDEIDRLLFTTENGVSAGYERFARSSVLR